MKKPSLADLKNFASTKKIRRLGLSFMLAAVAMTDGGPFYNYAQADKFTLRSNFGKVASNTTASGVYLHLAPISYVHDYHRGVQMIDYPVGGMQFLPFGNSTSDQNHLSASIKMNYRVIQDTKKLGYHAWEMDGFLLPDGFLLLTDLMNQSGNAVMGNRTMAETISNPERFTKEYYEDLMFRFEQNNVPIEVESLEFQKFNTTIPTKTVSYQKIINAKSIGPTGQ